MNILLNTIIDVKTLEGRSDRLRLLKLLYDTRRKFTSAHLLNCSNANQHFVALENLGLTSYEVIPHSNGTRLRFISEEQREEVEEYLEERGLLDKQDEKETV